MAPVGDAVEQRHDRRALLVLETPGERHGVVDNEASSAFADQLLERQAAERLAFARGAQPVGGGARLGAVEPAFKGREARDGPDATLDDDLAAVLDLVE
jgi:hypothetical protein